MERGVLRAESVSKTFGGVRAVDGCSVAVVPASITAIIGPNGSGKTTLINLMSGTYRPDDGRILFDGEVVTSRGPARRFDVGIVRTFQRSRVFQEMSVIENLLFLHGSRAEIDAADFESEVNETIARLELGPYVGALAGSLSFGYQRRLELARAIVAHPRVLLLDELFAGVDPATVGTLAAEVRRLADDGVATAVVDHDVDLVFDLADQVVVMDRGTPMAHGTPDEIRHDQRVAQIYLG